MQSGSVFAQTMEKSSLQEWMRWMEAEASYHFLYRESLIRSITVEWDRTQSPAKQFQQVLPQLNAQSLELSLDQEAKQVVIYPLLVSTKSMESNRVNGVVLDAETGERLPFATVQWEEHELSRGVSSNHSGVFEIRSIPEVDTLRLRFSYIGYETLYIDWPTSFRDGAKNELSVRLKPVINASMEVVVESNGFITDQVATQETIDLINGRVLGEENTISALQALPSVQLNSALNNGIHLRGSPADGFNVFLDGMRMYNQSHIFGLFDTFNASAIQYASLFYDVIPATLDAAAGGVLYLDTRNGSLNEQKWSTGLSNSSVRLTYERPLSKARNSVLFSVKHSLLDQFAPLNTINLVHWGLDANRNRRPVNSSLSLNVDNQQLVQLSDASAQFGDLHLGLLHERKNGGRVQLNAYYGFDSMQSDYEKLTEIFDANSPNGRRLSTNSAQTRNLWDNAKISAHVETPLGNHWQLDQMIGYSLFKSDFSKDDFGFFSIDPLNGSLERLEFPLQIRSIINDVGLNQQLQWVGKHSFWSFGLDYHYLMAEYFEDSINKPQLYIRQKAHKADAYVSGELQLGNRIQLRQGLRLSYFDPDQTIRWSPRIKVQSRISEQWLFALGYSKVYQFMNRVRFSNVLSSDVWVLADREQAPMQVQSISAGLYFKSENHFSLQLEAYRKHTDHLRIHELDWYTGPSSFVRIPWFSNSKGQAEGVELTIAKQFGNFSVRQSYTWSKSTIQNPELNNGQAFFADWDRRHQSVSMIKWNFSPHLELSLTQNLASGNPNRLFVLNQDSKATMDHFARTDVSLSWVKEWKNGSFNLIASVYNFTNRENEWYREMGLLLDPSNSNRIFSEGPIQVYDLGIQPSISFEIHY